MHKKNKYSKDIISKVSTLTNNTSKVTGKAITFIIKYITQELANQSIVNIRNIGKFFISTRNRKKTTHPITAKEYIIPKRNIITCKFSKNLIHN